jgi:hypothetical protein
MLLFLGLIMFAELVGVLEAFSKQYETNAIPQLGMFRYSDRGNAG